MKTKFSFKQIFSDVFALKSKTITMLLGTIVPFFACYAFAATAKRLKGKVECNPLLPLLILSVLLYLTLFICIEYILHTSIPGDIDRIVV